MVLVVENTLVIVSLLIAHIAIDEKYDCKEI